MGAASNQRGEPLIANLSQFARINVASQLFPSARGPDRRWPRFKVRREYPGRAPNRRTQPIQMWASRAVPWGPAFPQNPGWRPQAGPSHFFRAEQASLHFRMLILDRRLSGKLRLKSRLGNILPGRLVTSVLTI